MEKINFDEPTWHCDNCNWEGYESDLTFIEALDVPTCPKCHSRNLATKPEDVEIDFLDRAW